MSRASSAALRLAKHKLEGGSLGDRELERLVRDYTNGDIDDDAMTQWLRAVCAEGMTIDETTALTRAMVASGDTIDWSYLDGAVVDKHSTGGVGDAVSLVAVPVAAACGARVAKLSGRALGHTGGTLDKLECVPGTRVELNIEEFKAQVELVGCAIAAASVDLAPADKKLYALRHKTGTVASIPLIAASIMSKKIAAGAPAIVLDVKVGSGSFMRGMGEARELARTMVDIGSRMGKRVRALLTAMDAPLADAVGDALELDQALLVLDGGGSDRLREISCAMAGAMLETCGVAGEGTGPALADNALRSGAARDKFGKLLEAQGGDLDRFDRTFPVGSDIAAVEDGYIEQIDAGTIGETVAKAKRGRGQREARRLGGQVMRRIGEAVGAGDSILRYIDSEPDPANLRLLNQAFKVGKSRPSESPLVLAVMT